MAILSYDRVRKLLVDQGQTQLAQLNDAYSNALYDRLLSAHLLLLETANRLDPGAPQWSAGLTQHLKTRFDAMMRIRPDGTPTVLLGVAHALPELTGAERIRLAKGGTILKTSGAGDPSAPIFIAYALDPRAPSEGILAAELNKEFLWRNVDTLGPVTAFCVLDDLGKLLFCSQQEPPAVLLRLARQLPPLASGRFKYAVDGEVQLAHHRELFLEPRFLVQGWTVIVVRPEADLLAPLDDFEMMFLPAALLSLLIAALLSLTQVRRTLVPLKKLIEGTRGAGNQDFSTRVPVAGNDEFGELAISFNAMNARLGNQFTALTTLAEIDRAILSRLDVDRVVETVVTRIRHIVQTDYVSVAVLDRTAPGMMQIYTRDGEDSTLERSAHPAQDTLELLAHPSGIWFETGAVPRAYALPVTRLGATAVFASPITWQQSVVGIVVLGFRGDASLTADDRARTRDLGDRIGVAFAAVTKDEQLYYQAHYDPLTALPNRLYFRDHLERTLARAHRGVERFALLFVDLVLQARKRQSRTCGRRRSLAGRCRSDAQLRAGNGHRGAHRRRRIHRAAHRRQIHARSAGRGRTSDRRDVDALRDRRT